MLIVSPPADPELIPSSSCSNLFFLNLLAFTYFCIPVKFKALLPLFLPSKLVVLQDNSDNHSSVFILFLVFLFGLDDQYIIT